MHGKFLKDLDPQAIEDSCLTFTSMREGVSIHPAEKHEEEATEAKNTALKYGKIYDSVFVAYGVCKSI